MCFQEEDCILADHVTELQTCALPISVNKEVAEENPKWHAEADSFVSNGPFTLESWEHNKELMMVKNDEYWDQDTVNLDKIHWAMVKDTNTEYQMFENGELDMTDIPSDMAEQLIDGDKDRKS